MILLQTATAIAPGNKTSFKGSGGTAPYTYSVVSGGGSIDASTGLYTAPSIPSKGVVIRAVDSSAPTPASATAALKVSGPYKLFLDVIQNFMSLEDNQLYIYNQKVRMPEDDLLYIAVKILMDKPFSNINKTAPNGTSVIQTVNFNTMFMIDILSRTTEAMDRRHEVIMALQSVYSKQQQTLNGFAIAKLPTAMLPLNSLEGSAIPFRFNITVGMQYAIQKINNVPYFDTFLDPDVQPDP